MTQDLETMLNELSDEEYSQEDTDTLIKKVNEYQPCIGCDRRMLVGLFKEGGSTCCYCRGIDAYGNKITIKKDEFGGL